MGQVSRVNWASDGLPSYAGARANPYNSRVSAYNWKASNTRKLRAALGRAQAGTGRASLGFIGDSETDYYIGTGNDFLNMWPRVMRSVLASLGIPVGGTGLVWAPHYGPAVDPRWTVGAGWTNANNYMTTTTSGATLTFASGDPGTAVDLVVFGTSGSLGWNIDSGAATGTLTPSGGLVPVKYTLATGLANTTHSLVLTTSSTAARYVIAARVYGASGVEVHNAAAFGSSAAGTGSWTDGADPTQIVSRVSTLQTASPDVVWCALGVNDINTSGTAPATVIAAISSLRSTFSTSDFVLVAQYQPATNSGWEPYVSALYDLADSLDVPLIDLYDRSGGTITATANGLMGDTVHPNAAAQRDWGRLAALIAAG